MTAEPVDPAAAETILCDTSFVSVVQSAHDDPRAAKIVAAWPDATKARLNGAILAISVITLAELRDGHIYGNWGERRRARAEGLIASYLRVPLDMTIVDCCAEIRAACRRKGANMPDNDHWIAATAITRGWPLASLDGHFDHIDGMTHLLLPRE